MTDHGDDKLSRRYREAAREEPGAELDAAILAASRRAVGAGPRRRSSWMVPTSIAAVLVLGIGVSLRMQMEKPGIETSVPGGSAEYPVPSDEPAPPPPASRPVESQLAPAPRAAAQPEARHDAPTPLAKRIEPAAKAPARPQAAEQARKEAAPVLAPLADAPASPPAVAMSAPATTTTTATAPPPPAVAGAAAPAQRAAPAGEPRMKREALAADNAAARESRAALGAVADPDPARELERIGKLRGDGRHAEADRALEEFRRRHSDYRIPEAVWERVKPR